MSNIQLQVPENRNQELNVFERIDSEPAVQRFLALTENDTEEYRLHCAVEAFVIRDEFLRRSQEDNEMDRQFKINKLKLYNTRISANKISDLENTR
jgi:hypothetical protein